MRGLGVFEGEVGIGDWESMESKHEALGLTAAGDCR